MTKKAAEIDKQNTFRSDIAITTKNEVFNCFADRL